MSAQLLGRSSLLVAAAVVLSACSPDSASSPLAPAASVERPSLEVVRPPVLASTLDRHMSLDGILWVTQVIGPEGGEFKIKAAGLKVEVPAGAVSEPTLFTAVALPGDAYAYAFGPHGKQFAKPLHMQQDLPNKALDRLPHGTRLEIAYFASTSQLDQTVGEVVVNEFLPVAVDVKRSKLTWDVSHFSGYVVSSGRKGTITAY